MQTSNQFYGAGFGGSSDRVSYPLAKTAPGVSLYTTYLISPMAKTLIRFDWAMKRLLRQKSNFDILEGFLSELLQEDIKIEQILESESNQDEAALKFNRVDLLALNSKGQLIIIELQADSEVDYFFRMAFATAKAVVEHFNLSDQYENVKKVYSINIVYFNLGQGEDYVYHGRTEFRGLHTNDVLELSKRQQKRYSINHVYEIYPEYYILKVNAFNDLAKDTLDEWMYYLKNNEVRPGSQAKGLAEVQKRLEFEGLSERDRRIYIKDIENQVIERSIYRTNVEEAEERGMERGIEQGLEKGEQIGIDKARTEAAEATRQGIVRALQRGKLTVDEIAEDFGVSVADVLAIRQAMA